MIGQRRPGREEGREPEDEAGADHHHDAPEHGPVVELLQVHVPVELGPLLLHAEHEEDVVAHVERVLRPGQHREREPLLGGEERQVEQVVDGRDDDQDGADAVPERRALRAAEDLHERLGVGRRVLAADDGRVPERPGAAQRPAGDPEEDHAGQHEPVLDALVDVEADDAPHRIDARSVAVLRLEPLAQLVDEVDEDVEGEEGSVSVVSHENAMWMMCGTGCPPVSCGGLCAMSAAKLSFAPSWQRAQASLRFATWTIERGSFLETIACVPPLPCGAAWQAHARRRVGVAHAGEPAVDRVVVGDRRLGVEAGRLRELLVPVARLAPPRHLAAVLRDRLPCLALRIVEGERLHRVRRAVAGRRWHRTPSCPREATSRGWTWRTRPSARCGSSGTRGRRAAR